jgi:hypothetical protein
LKDETLAVAYMEVSSVTLRLLLLGRTSASATGVSDAAEGLGCGGDDLVVGDVAEPLRDVPPVAKWVD